MNRSMIWKLLLLLSLTISMMPFTATTYASTDRASQDQSSPSSSNTQQNTQQQEERTLIYEGDSKSNTENNSFTYHVQVAPATVQLDTIASFQLTQDLEYMNGQDAAAFTKFLDTGDLLNGSMLGMINIPKTDAWIILQYVESGHILDTDYKQIDSQELLSTYCRDIEEQNKKAAADKQLQVVGWGQVPKYDRPTRTLSWDLMMVSDPSDEVFNYNARILTRTGYISVLMITTRDHYAYDTGILNQSILPHIRIQSGSTYDSYIANQDHVSKMTLQGLIASGAGIGAAHKYSFYFFVKKLWYIVALIAVGIYLYKRNRAKRDLEHELMIEEIQSRDYQQNELPIRRPKPAQPMAPLVQEKPSGSDKKD
ncbi:DUF2167 domain-containing protein [Paenibacillus sp. WLX1005]|uniref:DUF2167 domain-containing protein n=1 Tax=Paenibacillus sp. WLX1005 TaxID=3243766 RepID=UPI0039845AF2